MRRGRVKRIRGGSNRPVTVESSVHSGPSKELCRTCLMMVSLENRLGLLFPIGWNHPGAVNACVLTHYSCV